MSLNFISIWVTVLGYLAISFPVLAQTTGGAGTTCKFERVSMSVAVRKGEQFRGESPSVCLDYSIVVNTDSNRIRKPGVFAYAVIERKDTTRVGVGKGRDTTRLENQDKARWSLNNEEVASTTIRRIKGTTQGRFFVSKGDKVLIVRLELWHEGKLRDVWQSIPETQREKLGIPEFWYSWY